MQLAQLLIKRSVSALFCLATPVWVLVPGQLLLYTRLPITAESVLETADFVSPSLICFKA